MIRRELREGRLKGMLVYGNWLIDPDDAERIMREYPLEK